MTLGGDVGGGGGGEGKGEGGAAEEANRQWQRLMPWEGTTFRTPSVYEMAFCACTYVTCAFTKFLKFFHYLFLSLIKVKSDSHGTELRWRSVCESCPYSGCI